MAAGVRTLAGDRVVVKEARFYGYWTASCEGCGWAYEPTKGWNAGYQPDVERAAHQHAQSCTGQQGLLW